MLLVVYILYHTLGTQKSMKPLFGHPVSKYRLRPWGGGGAFLHLTNLAGNLVLTSPLVYILHNFII